MKLLKIAILGSFLSLYLLFPTVSFASPVVFSEDFSSGLHKWFPTRDDGSWWSIVDGKAQALITNPSTVTELIPLDLYWDTSWKNLEYSLEVTPLQGVDRNISFVFQNVANWYELHFVSEFINLVRVKDGETPFNMFFPFSMVNGHTYQVKIKFNEGHIVVSIDNQEVINTTDWSFNQNFGKIGLKAGTGSVFPTQVLFDNIVVTLLDEASINLNVPLFKQSDNQWKKDEYDSAKNWTTQPSISRWGCALASAAMILQYHGIKTLPDGTELNPGTLNTWLNTQIDGYVGEGNLNWLAISRLTKLMSLSLSTPVLEYNRHPGDGLEVATAEINQHKPVVIELDGHFLVADGISVDGHDIQIKDPAYRYEWLSQHEQPVLSTRTFQPSHTDLSYVMVTASGNVKLKLLDAKGIELPGVSSFTESLTAPPEAGSEKTNPLSVVHLAKPESGVYIIEINQSELDHYSATVLTYTSEGEPHLKQLTGAVGPQPAQFKLMYDKNKPATLKPFSNWPAFKAHLKVAKNSRGFRSLFWYHLMDQTINSALKAPAKHRSHYLKLLRAELHANRWFMNGRTYSYLNEQLAALSQSQ